MIIKKTYVQMNDLFEIDSLLRCVSMMEFEVNRSRNKITLMKKDKGQSFNGLKPIIIIKQSKNKVVLMLRQRIGSLLWLILSVGFLLFFIQTLDIRILVSFFFSTALGLSGFYIGYLNIKNELDSMKKMLERNRLEGL